MVCARARGQFVDAARGVVRAEGVFVGARCFVGPNTVLQPGAAVALLQVAEHETVFGSLRGPKGL